MSDDASPMGAVPETTEEEWEQDFQIYGCERRLLEETNWLFFIIF